jgi:hypothetical protein
MKKVILRTSTRTKSNSFSDALFRTHFSDPEPWRHVLVCSVVNRLKTNEYLTVKFNQAFYLPEKVLYRFISGAYLVHGKIDKKMNGHIIDSNSVMKKCLIQQREC